MRGSASHTGRTRCAYSPTGTVSHTLDDTVSVIAPVDITNAGRMAAEMNQLGFPLSALEERQHIVMVRDALGMQVTLPVGLLPDVTVSNMFAAADVLQVIRISDSSRLRLSRSR